MMLALASFTTTFMLANPLPALLSKTDDRRWVIGLFAGVALAGLCAMVCVVVRQGPFGRSASFERVANPNPFVRDPSV